MNISNVIHKIVGDLAWSWFRNLRNLGPIGFLKARKRLLACRQSLKPNAVKFAICAIVKNEGRYLEEWIDYHLGIGVQKFFIYDNESTDSTKDILQRYERQGIVAYAFFPGEAKQIAAYEDCIARRMHEAEWIAFIDADEFILPVSAEDLGDIFDRLSPDCTQVVMQWAIFGSNNLKHYDSRPVLERFTRRGAKMWPLNKAIVNPRRTFKISCHEHLTSGLTQWLPADVLRINHYHCKTWEEYSSRAKRGDGIFGNDFAQSKYSKATFDSHDLNEVEDTLIVTRVHKFSQ